MMAAFELYLRFHIHLVYISFVLQHRQSLVHFHLSAQAIREGLKLDLPAALPVKCMDYGERVISHKMITRAAYHPTDIYVKLCQLPQTWEIQCKYVREGTQMA